MGERKSLTELRICKCLAASRNAHTQRKPNLYFPLLNLSGGGGKQESQVLGKGMETGPNSGRRCPWDRAEQGKGQRPLTRQTGNHEQTT